MKIQTISASSISPLFDCAYSWEGSRILGMTMPSSGRAHLGSSLHQSTAIMDISKNEGNPLDVNEINDLFDEAFNNPGYDVSWENDDFTKRNAEEIGMILNYKYWDEVSNQRTFSAIEKQIDSLVIEVDKFDIAIELTGKMDRSRTISGNGGKAHGIVDLKSGKNAVDTFGMANTKGHAAQVGVYELLEEAESNQEINLPSQIIGLQTTKKANIGYGVIANAKDLVLGTDEYPGYIEMAAQILKSGIFPPNPKSVLCNKKYCARWHQCPYKGE